MITTALAGQQNGRPETPYYRYRARAYPQAAALNERAEAQHGHPAPTCLCGGPVRYSHDHCNGLCQWCGESPLDSVRRELVHGTVAGYRRHLKHGKPVCAACRYAEAEEACAKNQRRAAGRRAAS